MGYCFMSIQKIKTKGGLMSKYNHNYRQVDVDNADKELAYLNDEIIKLPTDESGKQMNYVEAFNDRLSTIPYYQTHSYRKNAVLAFEVVTTFSKDSPIDLEAWKQKNKEWLENTFNVAGDGRNNVISMVYHGDEAGEVHCHAIVVPIDERGRLNAARFTGGARAMSDLQSSYAIDMREFGLERGLKGSSAKHEDIRRFYAELNRAKDSVPEVKPGEPAQAYKERVLASLETMHMSTLRDIKEKERESRRRLDSGFIERRDEIARERNAFFSELEEGKEKKAKLESEISDLKEKKSSLEGEITDLEQLLAKRKKTVSRISDFVKGVNIYMESEPDKAQEMIEMFEEASRKGREESALEMSGQTDVQSFFDELDDER